ncbi:MAG: HD-GYP domain-containing protein [Candidatus Hydrogenedentes bacterium]|nr:HD-GYP domain-containing protein [Candidatus Hydrogenedentota bacterium]
MVQAIQEMAGGVKTLLQHLTAARKKARMYPSDHPYVLDSLRGFLQELARFLHEKDDVTLSVADEELYFDGARLIDEQAAFLALVKDFAARKVSAITFRRGVTEEELSKFITLSVGKPSDLQEAGGIRTLLERDGVRRIALDQKTLVLPGMVAAGPKAREAVRVSRDIYRTVVQTVIAAFMDATDKSKVNVSVLENTVGLVVAGIARQADLYLDLSRVKSFHEYTFFHSTNVAILSLLIASKLHFGDRQMHRLGVAALLHDIGKVKTPMEILDKPGRLTEAEFKIMQKHPVDGARILAGQEDVDGLAITIAAQHHAHYNMTGYPNFQRLGRLHFLSHLVTIADVFDALTSDRSYRKALLPDRAMQIILNGRGTTFHPLLTKVFVQLSGVYPVGSVVELDDGAVAAVCKPNPDDVFRPWVRPVSASVNGRGGNELINLSEKASDGSYLRSIVRSLDPRDRNIEIASQV